MFKKLNVIRFISRRYLFSRKHISLISVLTGISIGGITLGTALLIVVLSVFNGFFEVIRGYLLTIDPDLRIEMAGQNHMVYDTEIKDRILEHPDVVNLAPFVSGKAMLVSPENRNEVVEVKGLEDGYHIRLAEIENSVRDGVFDLSVQNGRPGMVVSEALVNRYNIPPNTEVAMLSASGMRRAITQFSAPRASRFKIRGSYNIQQIVEGETVYVDMAAAQRLLNLRNRITGFELQLTDPEKAAEVQKELRQMLGSDYRIQTWYDLQKPLYDVMALEKWGSYFILMIIVLVAMLNIVGSLTMIVLQKKKDIGILISMGMTPKTIKKIFRSQGVQIGLIGCGAGGAIGILLSLAQKEYGIIRLTSSFIIDAYPVAIRPLDIVLILGFSMLLCLAASWYPASRAAAVDPADAVRDE